jgi:hypothetical protein
LQLTPTYIHRNLIEPTVDAKNLFSTGLGGRYKISKRVSVNAEYFYNFENKNFYKNPLSVGMDIDTGGHVFQLVFSNSQANTETGYISNATGDWGKGHFFFGFNLYRVFLNADYEKYNKIIRSGFGISSINELRYKNL